MSGMLKVIGAKPAPAQVNGIRVPSSIAGLAIPVVYGTGRMQGNLLDYIDWSSSGKSGKGGKQASKMGGDANTYKAAVIVGLCEGPIDGLAMTWSDKDNPADFNGVYVPNYGWALFTGTGPAQTPWSYMSTHHAALARSYPYTCYVANPNLNLPGDSTPHMTFEVLGFKRFGAGTASASGHVTGGGAQTFSTNLGAADGAYNNGFIEFTGGQLSGYIGQVTIYLHASGQVTVEVPFSVAPQNGDTFNIYPNSDALPSDVLTDALTDTNHGLALPSSMLGNWTSFAQYCQAVGLFVSAIFDQAQAANSALEKLFTIANCAPFWSDGVLKVVPYGDTAVTGNGITWTPNSTPIYNLTDDDFIRTAGDAPVKVTRKSPAEAYNRVTVDYEDRGFQYNTQTQEAKDDAAINQAGLVLSMPQLSYPEIKVASVARTVAQLQLQRSLWVRNTYAFVLPANFALLEPMDLVSLTSSQQGLSAYPVRLTSVNWTQDNQIECEAEDWPFGTATAALYGAGYSGGYIPDANVLPGNTNTPFIVDAPPQIATTPLDILINVSGGQFWGGCDVYVSQDNSQFTKVGQIINQGAYGVVDTGGVPAGPGAYPTVDTTSTLPVDLTNSGGSMVSQPNNAFAQLVPLIYVGGEWMCYETATLTATSKYDVTHLYRGLFGTTNASHSAGAAVGIIDFSTNGGTFRLPWPNGQAGQTLYFKFPAFNVYGKSQQDISTVTSYSHVIGVGSNATAAQLTLNVRQVSSQNGQVVIGVTVTDALGSLTSANLDVSCGGLTSLYDPFSVNIYPAGETLVGFTLGVEQQFTANLNNAFHGAGYVKFRAYATGRAAAYSTWYGAQADQMAEPSSVITIGSNNSTTDLTAKAAAQINAPNNIASIKWLAATTGYPTVASVVSGGSLIVGGAPFFITDLGVSLNLGDTVYLTVVPYDNLSAQGVPIQIKATRQNINLTKYATFNANELLSTYSSFLNWQVTNGTLSLATRISTNAQPEFGLRFTVPTGCAISNVAFDAYWNSGIPEGSLGVEVDRLTGSGAATMLGSNSASNVGWQTLNVALAETASTGYSYRGVVTFYCPVSPAEIGAGNITVTYTPPNTAVSV